MEPLLCEALPSLLRLQRLSEFAGSPVESQRQKTLSISKGFFFFTIVTVQTMFPPTLQNINTYECFKIGLSLFHVLDTVFVQLICTSSARITGVSFTVVSTGENKDARVNKMQNVARTAESAQEILNAAGLNEGMILKLDNINKYIVFFIYITVVSFRFQSLQFFSFFCNSFLLFITRETSEFNWWS